MMSSRLPTLSRTSTPGCALAKPAIRRGEKYFAVLTTPTEMPARGDALAAPRAGLRRRRSAQQICAGCLQHDLTCVRRTQAVAGAVEEHEAGLGLELLQLQRDGRRREP